MTQHPVHQWEMKPTVSGGDQLEEQPLAAVDRIDAELRAQGFTAEDMTISRRR
jgi:hypothetical protein